MNFFCKFSPNFPFLPRRMKTNLSKMHQQKMGQTKLYYLSPFFILEVYHIYCYTHISQTTLGEIIWTAQHMRTAPLTP